MLSRCEWFKIYPKRIISIGKFQKKQVKHLKTQIDEIIIDDKDDPDLK